MNPKLSNLPKHQNNMSPRSTPQVSALDMQYQSACLLMTSGQLQSARELFTEILKTDPTHLGTLINFAVLLTQTGYNSAAKTAYLQALVHHPKDLLAHINLANLYFQERNFKEAENYYDQVLSLVHSEHGENPIDKHVLSHYAHAHQGLALIHFEEGDQARADFHHSRGYSIEPVRDYAVIKGATSKNMLVLIGGRGGDVPWPSFVDQSYFAVHTLAIEHLSKSQGIMNPLHSYDLIFNAIGDADSSLVSLKAAQDWLEQGPYIENKNIKNAAVNNAATGQVNLSLKSSISSGTFGLINPPSAVVLTGRKSNSERFKKLPFVKTPLTTVIARKDFESAESLRKVMPLNFQFPVVFRSLGFQTGKHFEFASSVEELFLKSGDLPGAELLVMEFLNTRDEKGYYSKYRVMFIDGEMYPLHLALSKHWKVHYFSAAMKDSPENRGKEKFFLENMQLALGTTAITALKSIQNELGLDYAGVDFGLSAQGEVLVFEANATMIMALPGADEMWDYRRTPILNARKAAQQMLIRRASR